MAIKKHHASPQFQSSFQQSPQCVATSYSTQNDRVAAPLLPLTLCSAFAYRPFPSSHTKSELCEPVSGPLVLPQYNKANA
eukprot:6972827-Pyramimonas_sp.AAC.1